MNYNVSRPFALKLSVSFIRHAQGLRMQDNVRMMGEKSFCSCHDQMTISFHDGHFNHLVETWL